MVRDRVLSWKKRSRRALALVLTLSLAPALLLWWCALVYFERSLEEQARGRLGGVVEAQSRRLAGELEERGRWLRQALQRPEVEAALSAWDGRPSGERARALETALLETLGGKAPFRTIFAGRGLEPPVAAGGAASSALEWATRDLPTGQRSPQAMRVIPRRAEPASEELALAIPAPGPPGSWLGGVLEAHELGFPLKISGGRGILLLVRDDGAVLAEGAAAAPGARLGEIAADRRRRGGWWRGSDPAGDPVFRCAEWMPAGIDLVLVAELPVSEALAGLSGFHAVGGLAAALGLGLLALGVLLALRTVGRPVDRLEQALAALGSGGAGSAASGSGVPSLAPAAPESPDDALVAGVLEGVAPAQQSAVRWRRRAQRLEELAGRLSDLALVECGRDGRIRSLSAGASRLTGFAEGGMSGTPLRELFEPPDWERIAARLFGAGEEAEQIRDRVRVRRRGATPVEAELTVLPLGGPEAGGAPETEGYLLALREVAPRTEQERRLGAAEARLRSIVEGISDGVGILRQERFEYVNPALAELLGHSASELMGRTLSEFVRSRDLLPVREAISSASRGAPTAEAIEAGLRKTPAGGGQRVLLTMGPGSERGTALAVLRDVTDLARAEASLEQERRRLDLTLESTSDGILAVQHQAGGSRAMLANRRLLELFGVDAETVTGSAGREVWEELGRRIGAGEGWQGRAALFGAPSEAAYTERVEATLPSPRTLEVFCGPIRDDRGAVIGRVATFRDISDQRRAERALKDQREELASSRGELERAYRELELLNQDLQRRTQELTRLNRELKSLDEMKSGLLANVSHELQTPLVSVKGYSEMILKEKLGPLTEQQRRGLEISVKNVNRLIGLIDNLLSFSRMEGEMVDLRLESFALRPAIEEAIETLRARATERGVEIALAPAGEELMVRADRDKIAQVFVNLLSNAVKFNRPGGSVRVESEAGRRGFVKVEIRDTGIGIPREALDKIFERFYQVDAGAARRQDGTGIGLSIVKNILRMHGCMIRADSVEGEGSVFSFTLPAARRGRSERQAARHEADEGAAGAGPADRAPNRERARPSRPLEGDEPA